MYTIGQVSEIFNLPVSTLRYYDKQGLFPALERSSGIRKFSNREIEALRVIECLKKSGLKIKDIKRFIDWCAQGESTYEKRKELFIRQRESVENEIANLNKTLDMLNYKCRYYELLTSGENEESIKKLIAEHMPEDIRPVQFEKSENKAYTAQA